MQHRPILLSVIACVGIVAVTTSTFALQKSKHRGHKSSAKGGSSSAGAGSALAVVDAFEKAYQRKDKNTMILKLMTPTKEVGLLNKRYQWLRGYGVDEKPSAVRPPILFTTAPGSYVPTTYKVVSSGANSSQEYSVTVKEKGGCREEGVNYSVERVRRFKIVKMNGKWLVSDYVNPTNTEEYGFFVDDISDKMVKK